MYKSIAASTVVALLATTAAFAQVPGSARDGQEKGGPVSPGRDTAPPEKMQKQDAPSPQKGAEGEKAPAKDKQKTSEPAGKSGGENQKDRPKTAEPKASDKARDNRSTDSKDQPTKDEPRTGAVKNGDGKAAGGGSGKPSVSVEQRRQITTVFARHRGTARSTVNIDVRVGTRVPRNVTLVAVPEDIVVIVPEYRRYRYFIVADQVVIVDPTTFEIVEILVITA